MINRIPVREVEIVSLTTVVQSAGTNPQECGLAITFSPPNDDATETIAFDFRDRRKLLTKLLDIEANSGNRLIQQILVDHFGVERDANWGLHPEM